MTHASFPATQATRYDIAAWIIAALLMLLLLVMHLLPALLAGLLVYEVVRLLVPVFARHVSNGTAKGVAVGLLVLLIGGVTAAAVFGIAALLQSEGGSLSALLSRMADIIDASREQLPAWLASALPDNAQELREALTSWLRQHAEEVQRIGRETGHLVAHLLIGMIVGVLVSLREASSTDVPHGPLARALCERTARLAHAFRCIVFAQVRISAINASLTALYLAIILPLFGVHLPLVKTLIVLTFVVGLLPVVGNLVSNTVIVVVSLAHSPHAAVASLTFLVLVHKLEYFLNARIVGAQIRASAWELLTAMLLMESAFGLAGLVAAPIFYAWLKDELSERGLI
ncbi:AI-2E family transporter [Rhodocyclus gracilis]|uniref:AI-2E family transporter n=1 Tax=Rhodocyclus tenuis TaxID=1066 RepID=A0A6L5JS90_RHOTE|nr:AI-2E family transporter [Rhodocyclus gracilis]MQY50245.1 AI-2E family transporter [Rhodocyclus gracilis]